MQILSFLGIAKESYLRPSVEAHALAGLLGKPYLKAR